MKTAVEQSAWIKACILEAKKDGAKRWDEVFFSETRDLYKVSWCIVFSFPLAYKPHLTFKNTFVKNPNIAYKYIYYISYLQTAENLINLMFQTLFHQVTSGYHKKGYHQIETAES